MGLMNKSDRISFTRLQEADFPLMLSWFNAPHVQEFYSLRTWRDEELYAKLTPYTRGKSDVNGFIMHLDNQPLGYIQKYPIKNHPWDNQEIDEEIIVGSSGLDLFIGEASYTQKGLGKRFVERFLESHVWSEYEHCFIDPDVRNNQSIKLFQKLGFVEHKRINTKNKLGNSVELILMMKSHHTHP